MSRCWLACYPSLTALPERPDRSISDRGGEGVEEVRVAGALGISAAWCMRAGLPRSGKREPSFSAGSADAAAESGVAICGPIASG